GSDGRRLQPSRCRRGRPVPAIPPRAARLLGLLHRSPDGPLRNRRAAGSPHCSGRRGRADAARPQPARAEVVGARQTEGQGCGADDVIEVDGLTVRFGGVVPIDRMTVSFDSGTCGLIGPNGAGKTTFFNVLSGFVKPAAGSVQAFGQDLLEMAD